MCTKISAAYWFGDCYLSISIHFFVHSNLRYLAPHNSHHFQLFATPKKKFIGFYSHLKVYIVVFIAHVGILIISSSVVHSVGEDSCGSVRMYSESAPGCLS